MEQCDLFSPIDYRYHCKELAPYLSEKAFFHYKLKVELAIVRGFYEKGLCSKEIFKEIRIACKNINYKEVAQEEEKTRHDIRALVNCIRNKVSNKAKCFVHLGATSYDIVDTANSARYRDAILKVIIPNLKDLGKVLAKIAQEEADTIQIGRTHGQHAIPITFGFWAANFLNRLDLSITHLKSLADKLPGKFSGAVGTYRGISNALKNLEEKQKSQKAICPRDFERLILSYLDLKSAKCSTQITNPEDRIRLFSELTVVMGIMANLSRDLRHLQRTEIAEVGELFEKNQIGSSTMPHKQNPITFENIESLWKIILPRMQTLLMDQISEHQRDLTSSASSRTYAEIMVYVNHATKSLIKSLESLSINKEAMARNVLKDDTLSAEQVYIYLATSMEDSNAYEKVRQWVHQAKAEEKSLESIISRDRIFHPVNEVEYKLAEDTLSKIVSLIKDSTNPDYLAAKIAKEVAREFEP